MLSEKGSVEKGCLVSHWISVMTCMWAGFLLLFCSSLDIFQSTECKNGRTSKQCTSCSLWRYCFSIIKCNMIYCFWVFCQIEHYPRNAPYIVRMIRSKRIALHYVWTKTVVLWSSLSFVSTSKYFDLSNRFKWFQIIFFFFTRNSSLVASCAQKSVCTLSSEIPMITVVSFVARMNACCV